MMCRLLASASAMVFLLHGSPDAKTIRVPQDYPRIRAACEVALDGDTVAVSSGTYNECIQTYTDVTITGVPGDSTAVKVQTMGHDPCFVPQPGSSIVIQNLEMHAYADFSAIILAAGDGLVVENCHLVHHCIEQQATVVRALSGSVTLRRCYVDFDFACDQYPVEFAGSTETYLVEDCVIRANWNGLASVVGIPYEPGQGSVYEFRNNTIEAEYFFCCAYSPDCSLIMVNNIISMVYCALPAETMEWRHNCLIDGWLSGPCGYQIGNFIADPLFCDAVNEDYRLRPDSPCLGAGEGGEDVGAHRGVCWSGDAPEHSRPVHLRLSGPWPNPTTGGAVMLAHGVTGLTPEVVVLDVCGNRVATASAQPTGSAGVRFEWDGLDAHGRPVAAGVYYLHMPGAEGNESRRLVVVR